jgi:hypothetical protein
MRSRLTLTLNQRRCAGVQCRDRVIRLKTAGSIRTLISDQREAVAKTLDLLNRLLLLSAEGLGINHQPAGWMNAAAG